MISDGFNLSKRLLFSGLGAGSLSSPNYPASGSFIDVSPFERFAFLIQVASGNSSAISAEVKQASANNGALSSIPVGMKPTCVLSEAKDYILEVDVSHLDINNGARFVSLAIAGGTPTGAITFIGIPKKKDTPIAWPKLGEAVLSVG